MRSAFSMHADFAALRFGFESGCGCLLGHRYAGAWSPSQPLNFDALTRV